AIAGIVLAWRQQSHTEPAAIALAILAIAMTSKINIGIRHILPMYLPLSMLAGYAIASIRPRVVGALALVWLLADSITAHPDYLPWMNALVGGHPGRGLADGNFDWGRDKHRLLRECRRDIINNLG